MQFNGVLTNSDPLVMMVTSLTYQPLLPSVPVGVRVTPVGAVLSIFTVMTLLGVLVFPARSVTVCAVDDTAAPSVLSTWSAGHAPGLKLEPPLSAHVKRTVTLLVYQPFVPKVTHVRIAAVRVESG